MFPAGQPWRLPDRCRPRVQLRWFVDRTRYGPLYKHVGRIDGWVSFNGIHPRQNEHVIILANSEATSVLDISAAITLG